MQANISASKIACWVIFDFLVNFRARACSRPIPDRSSLERVLPPQWLVIDVALESLALLNSPCFRPIASTAASWRIASTRPFRGGHDLGWTASTFVASSSAT